MKGFFLGLALKQKQKATRYDDCSEDTHNEAFFRFDVT